MTMLEFALFGAGRIGRIHAHNLVRRRDARLTFVVDTDADAAAALAQECGATAVDGKGGSDIPSRGWRRSGPGV